MQLRPEHILSCRQLFAWDWLFVVFGHVAGIPEESREGFKVREALEGSRARRSGLLREKRSPLGTALLWQATWCRSATGSSLTEWLSLYFVCFWGSPKP